MMKKFLPSTGIIKWQTWVLLFLILLGTFLRTYHFHDWMLFGDDQIRDAYITSDVVTGKSPLPLTGPFMSYSGNGEHGEENSFHLGPVYYYFQMISAKIFGNYPDKLAYPDVFFSILSIPLFYLFLRLYFSKNISLGLTGLYAVSAYFISYSRFAWNTNLIPFFVILFLLSLYKFLEKNEKTHWIWVLSLGFALGVGFQLHAIVMIIFSVVAFLVFLVSIKRNYQVWKKWAVVLLVFLILNTSQIISEAKTNLSNTKTLFRQSNGLALSKLKNDADCHIEANFFFLSSYSSGNSQCYYNFVNLTSGDGRNYYLKNFQGKNDFIILLTSLLFSAVGYFFLIYYNKKEEDAAKKYFLRLIAVYFMVGFLIMLPLSKTDINEFRYFTFGFFMPFLFLGFLVKFMAQKFTWLKIYLIPVAIIFYLLITSNTGVISAEAKSYSEDNVTCSNLYKTNLGELEPVVQYMVSSSNGQDQIYLGQNSSQRIILDALTYLLKQQSVEPVKFENKSYAASGDEPVFYVSCKIPRVLPTNTTTKANNATAAYKKIGPIYVYQLNSSGVSK